MFLAAVVQLTSTSDAAKNAATVERLVRRAAGYGAKLVVTPENTDFLGPHADKVRRAEPVDGPYCAWLGALAAELGITLVLGSFAERAAGPASAAPFPPSTPGTARGFGASDPPDSPLPANEAPNPRAPAEGGGIGAKPASEAGPGDRKGARCHNTSVVFGPDGKIVASYRKIHLFDVDVSADVRFRESDTVAPGSEPVVAESALGPIGMSVCYDLRFPELYRALRDGGATMITIPSAFTLTTGKDHWEPLIRARAIETQCWVLAPGQSGRHDDGGLRQSYGHSMIVDPWGHVVARASDGPGIALAEVDPERVVEVRRGMPVASHRRLGC